MLFLSNVGIVVLLSHGGRGGYREFCSVMSWGGWWGGYPPPPDLDFTVGKMKFTKGNIDLGNFWYTNCWIFGFQIPPPAP